MLYDRVLCLYVRQQLFDKGKRGFFCKKADVSAKYGRKYFEKTYKIYRIQKRKRLWEASDFREKTA